MGNHSNQDSVVCLKASNGAEIWRHSYACQEGKDGYPGPRATPTVDDFGVYTLSRDGQVFCLDPASGAIQWQANLPRDYPARTPQWGFASSALLTGDLVLWNAGAHGIALNRRTGEKVWASPPGVGNYAVPVLYQMQGRQCAAIFGQQELVGVEVASGRRLWSLPWKRDYDIMAAEPIIRGDHLFVTSGYKRGCGLYRLGDGEPQPVWTNKTLSCHMATPVLLNGHLYGPDGNTRAKVDLKCVDFLTGEVKWARENMNHFQIMAAGDKLILLIENGELVIAAAQPDGYKELARARVLTDSNLCWTMPVLCGGRIYCRSPKGELAAVDVSRP
jgi:outer membrane protein assembly factor BamB